jgi:hypothetical protein
MSKLITIQGKAQESSKKIEGYALPENIADFKTPAIILFAPNYSPILYKEEIGQNNGKPISRMVQVNLKDRLPSVDIVDKNLQRNWLLTKEGYILQWMKSPNSYMLISPSSIKSTPSATPSPIISNTKKDSAPVSNKSIDSTQIFGSFEKTARNIQIGWTLAGWGIFGFLAYKFWNKSNIWKTVIVLLGISNAYNTYKAFSNKSISETSDSSSKEKPSRKEQEDYLVKENLKQGMTEEYTRSALKNLTNDETFIIYAMTLFNGSASAIKQKFGIDIDSPEQVAIIDSASKKLFS